MVRLSRQGVVSLSAGDACTAAVARDGRLWAWGANGSGQLGLGDRCSRCSPCLVTVRCMPALRFAQVRRAALHLLGRKVVTLLLCAVPALFAGARRPLQPLQPVPGDGALRASAGLFSGARQMRS